MTRKNYPYIIVAAFSLALSFIYCPFFDIFFDDKEIFKYTGFLIKKGAVPYKDFFDHKPPIIFFLNSLGAIFGSWFFWIMNAGLVLYASIQFLKLNIQYKVVLPFILPLLFNFLLRNPYISNGIGLTREFTTIFILLFFCTMLNKKRFHFFFMGILTSLVFFTQQDQVIILLPFIIYALWSRLNNRKDFLIKTGQLAVGFLTIMLPILAYFILANALNYFWKDAFLFNLQWYTSPDLKPSLVQELIVLKNKIHEFGLDTLFIFLFISAVVSLSIGSKTKWLYIVSISTIPLSFISEFLSGKIAIGDAHLDYYLLPLAATVPIALFILFAFTKKAVFKNRIHQIIYGCLLIFPLFLNTAGYIVNYHKYPQDFIDRSAEIKYLDKNPPKDYELYIFNNSNYIYAYNKYQVKAPSKWLYHYFWTWYQHWDEQHEILYSIIEDLQRHRTKYIISFDSVNHFKNAGSNEIWRRFLDSVYTPIKPLNIWRLKQ